MFKKNSTILFQGDSVTDVGRSHINDAELGDGYPFFVKQTLDEKYPDFNVNVINRGISGNRAIDLVGRWQKDCIDLTPDYVSILIGVNDTWRKYDDNDPTTNVQYKSRYKKIIEDTLNTTNAKILLLTPFLLNVNDNFKMMEDLIGKQKVVCGLAEEYKLPLLDLQFAFDVAGKFKDPSYFSGDSVHPTKEGHQFIAEIWLDFFNKSDK